MSGLDPNAKDGLSQADIDAALAGATGDDAAQPAPVEGQAAEPAAAPAEPAAAQAEVPATQAAAPAPESSEAGVAGLTQADIDAALAGASTEPAPAAVPVQPVKLDSAGRPFDDMAAMMEAAIAEERAAARPAPAAAAPAAAAAPVPANAVPLDLPDFTPAGAGAPDQGIELLNDVELNVKIELGRAEMLIEDVIKLGEGSVVELDKLAGDPVDVLVNDRLVARGEVIVLNENFCVRVSEIIAGVPEEEAA
jgi:flagellar motor switch protein FliN